MKKFLFLFASLIIFSGCSKSPEKNSENDEVILEELENLENENEDKIVWEGKIEGDFDSENYELVAIVDGEEKVLTNDFIEEIIEQKFHDNENFDIEGNELKEMNLKGKVKKIVSTVFVPKKDETLFVRTEKGKEFISFFRKTLEFDESGWGISEKWEQLDENQNLLATIIIDRKKVYFENGKVKKIIIKNPTGETTKFYNFSGRVVFEEINNSSFGKSTKSYVYDSKGELKEVISFTPPLQGSTTEPSILKTIYNNETITKKWANEKIDSIEYLNKNKDVYKKIQYLHKDYFGYENLEAFFEYEYDDKNNWREKISKNDNSEDEWKITREITYYEE